jgi:hypothetical protein
VHLDDAVSGTRPSRFTLSLSSPPDLFRRSRRMARRMARRMDGRNECGHDGGGAKA